MENKKHTKANIENNQAVFMQLGIALALAATLFAFEWGTRGAKSSSSSGTLVAVEMAVEFVPVASGNTTPPVPQHPDTLVIVEDSKPIENELTPYNAAADEQTLIIVPSVLRKAATRQTFQFVEKMPCFPGGKNKLKQFISNNLAYPPELKDSGIEGRIYVRFLVRHDGTIQNISLLNHLHPAIDAEALRLVNSFPRWEAGQNNGKNVNVWFTLPLNFLSK